MNYLTSVDPPTFEDPIPYPNCLDPETGSAFTAERLTEIHQRLMYQFLLMGSTEVTCQTLALVPNFTSIYLAASRFASRCLFDTLSVANEDGDAGALRLVPPDDRSPDAPRVLLLKAQALIEAALAQEVAA